MPVEFENRTRIGVDGWLKCGALLRPAASEDGVNVPLRRIPRAWAEDNVSDAV